MVQTLKEWFLTKRMAYTLAVEVLLYVIVLPYLWGQAAWLIGMSFWAMMLGAALPVLVFARVVMAQNKLVMRWSELKEDWLKWMQAGGAGVRSNSRLDEETNEIVVTGWGR